MSKHARYQILDPIAQGDFATVYRGFDLELNREVAIKQIHPQFLADPSKLDRYWQEAKLLASLEHPYIMTIYDIVRERGWLILELMQGSLKQQLNGRPIDLEDLRLTIVYMSHALGFLHKNGIVHGDVKPSNLLLDKNQRVKLGDFGIARRLAGDDGSVIKGTTKYMAPEVVSDQFGPVGHHSDLYSLGFASYELMCGEHFDSLFPGLHMFGRDPQIAWMMWHGAKDRSVPEIDKVLEGVPPELSRVVHKLTQKDPTNRYLDSEEVIFDLKSHSEGKDPDEIKRQAAEEQAEEEKKKQRRRKMSYGAVGVSMIASLLIALFVGPNEETVAPPPDFPEAGVIANVDPDRQYIGVKAEGDTDPEWLNLNSDRHQILLNDQRVNFDALKVGDQITVERVTGSNNETYFQVDAKREPTRNLESAIVTVDANHGTIQLRPPDAENEDLIEIYVPGDLAIRFNGRETWKGDKTLVSDLRPGDQASAVYTLKDSQFEAIELSITRVVSVVGSFEAADRDARELSIAEDDPRATELLTLPVANRCRVTLNGIEVLASGQQVTLADLRHGDTLTIHHDDQVRTIAAQREIVSNGVITRLDLESRLINVDLTEERQLVAFRLSDDCLIGLLGDGSSRSLDFLRVGDRVTVEHDSPDFVDATAQVVQVDPLPNPGVFAMVIGFERFDDSELSSVRGSAEDARHMAQILHNYYRVPEQQLLVSINTTKTGLAEDAAEFLADVPPNAQLLVYLSTRAYFVDDADPVFATLETRFDDLGGTGTSLNSLLDMLESVETRESILLLDVCHKGSGADLRRQPSVIEFVDSSRESPIHPISPTVTVVTSSGAGEVNQFDRTAGLGVFAKAVGDAYAGAGDVDGDHFVDSEELMFYLEDAMDRIDQGNGIAQHPVRFLPDPTPIRIQPETRDAVLELLDFMSLNSFSPTIQESYALVAGIQPDQPDISMAWALVNLKLSRLSVSRSVFEQVNGRFPDEIMPSFCLAWQQMRAGSVERGAREMTQFVLSLESPRSDEERRLVATMMNWIGCMQVFAVEAAEEPVPQEDFEELNAALQELDSELVEAHQAGVDLARSELDRQNLLVENASANDRATQEKVRSRIVTYVELDFSVLADYLRFRLDH